tara:strand:+ start:62 stop:574 length:513 start_codon:yes stop_codon:yes gene_type:complete
MAANESEILKRFRDIVANVLANPNADGWVRLLELLRKAEKDKRVKSSPGASEFLELTIELASDALTASTAEQAIEPLNHAMPLAIIGEAFRKGRKVNTGSPIRKAIARELAKDYTLKPRELWAILESKPPKGWDFDGEGRDGRIWVTGRKPMGYPRFSAVCKEEKDKLDT